MQTPVFLSSTNEMDPLSNSMAATFESYFGFAPHEMFETSLMGNPSAEDRQHEEVSAVAMWIFFWKVSALLIACPSHLMPMLLHIE